MPLPLQRGRNQDPSFSADVTSLSPPQGAASTVVCASTPSVPWQQESPRPRSVWRIYDPKENRWVLSQHAALLSGTVRETAAPPRLSHGAMGAVGIGRGQGRGPRVGGGLGAWSSSGNGADGDLCPNCNVPLTLCFPTPLPVTTAPALAGAASGYPGAGGGYTEEAMYSCPQCQGQFNLSQHVTSSHTGRHRARAGAAAAQGASREAISEPPEHADMGDYAVQHSPRWDYSVSSGSTSQSYFSTDASIGSCSDGASASSGGGDKGQADAPGGGGGRAWVGDAPSAAPACAPGGSASPWDVLLKHVGAPGSVECPPPHAFSAATGPRAIPELTAPDPHSNTPSSVGVAFGLPGPSQGGRSLEAWALQGDSGRRIVSSPLQWSLVGSASGTPPAGHRDGWGYLGPVRRASEDPPCPPDASGAPRGYLGPGGPMDEHPAAAGVGAGVGAGALSSGLSRALGSHAPCNASSGWDAASDSSSSAGRDVSVHLRPPPVYSRQEEGRSAPHLHAGTPMVAPPGGQRAYPEYSGGDEGGSDGRWKPMEPIRTPVAPLPPFQPGLNVVRSSCPARPGGGGGGGGGAGGPGGPGGGGIGAGGGGGGGAEAEREGGWKGPNFGRDMPTPKMISAALDEFVVGQESAKKVPYQGTTKDGAYHGTAKDGACMGLAFGE